MGVPGHRDPQEATGRGANAPLPSFPTSSPVLPRREESPILTFPRKAGGRDKKGSPAPSYLFPLLPLPPSAGEEVRGGSPPPSARGLWTTTGREAHTPLSNAAGPPEEVAGGGRKGVVWASEE